MCSGLNYNNKVNLQNKVLNRVFEAKIGVKQKTMLPDGRVYFCCNLISELTLQHWNRIKLDQKQHMTQLCQ